MIELLLTSCLQALPLQPREDCKDLAESRAQALSPDGRELAFSVDDGSVRFLDLSTGKVRRSVPGFPTSTRRLAWDPQGVLVAALGAEGEVRVIRSRDGEVISEFATPAPGTEWGFRTIEFVDGGTKLLITGAEAPAQLRDKVDGKLHAELRLDPKEGITATSISRDGGHLALGDRAGNFAVYSAETGVLEAGPFHGPEWVHTLAFDPSGTRLAAGSGDCKVRIVPIGSGAGRATLSHCDQDLFGDLSIGSAEFSPDGTKLLVTTFPYHEVRLWDIERGATLWSYDYECGCPGGIDASFSSDASRVVVSQGGLVFTASGKVERELVQKTCAACCAELGGSYLWTTKDSRLRVRDIRDGRIVADFPLAEANPR